MFQFGVGASTPWPTVPLPLASTVPDDLERLGEEIAGLAADLDTATYRLLARLREFDEREGWSGGFLSCAHWLSWRTGIDPGAAREKVRVARALAHLPRLSGAIERGQLSYSKVRALTRIATPANETELLELARHATASQVELFVRAWRRADRVAEAEAEQRRHEARHLTVRVDEDGSYVVRGRLDPEVGALLQGALERAVMALVQGEGDVEIPTAAQRRADALGLLVELALSNGGEPLPALEGTPPSPSGDSAVSSVSGRSSRSIRALRRVQVVLHVDSQALRADADGQSVLADGVRVSAETSRRLTCDATRVVMTHDTTGRVLDVGRRTRTVPAAIGRALETRDRGCRFPGCTNRIVDAHHVQHWADGGTTSLDNLLLLCRRHHRAVHEGGWSVVRTGGGAFVFTGPHGRVLPQVPPVAPLARDPVARQRPSPRRFDSANRSQGLGGGHPHARLDLDLAMRTIYGSREGTGGRPRVTEWDSATGSTRSGRPSGRFGIGR